MSKSCEIRRIRVGHSPDPDDAFMFYGLASGQVRTPGYEIIQVLDDIESLNRLALKGEIEVTAVSIHAFAHLTDRYLLLPCGASMGDGYGPMVVTRNPATVADLKSMTIAVPGRLTSAMLALRLALGEVKTEVVRFDRILDSVREGKHDAGLLIHEGQLTYGASGVHRILDLGEWWREETEGLPLPLGGNAIRRDLGARTIAEVGALLRESIEFGLGHREESLTYARRLEQEVMDSKKLWEISAREFPRERATYELLLAAAENHEAQLRDVMANVLFKLDRMQEAEAELDKLLALDDKKIDAFMSRGIIRQKRKDWDRARSDFRLYLELTDLPRDHPSVMEASRRLAQVEIMVDAEDRLREETEAAR